MVLTMPSTEAAVLGSPLPLIVRIDFSNDVGLSSEIVSLDFRPHTIKELADEALSKISSDNLPNQQLLDDLKLCGFVGAEQLPISFDSELVRFISSLTPASPDPHFCLSINSSENCPAHRGDTEILDVSSSELKMIGLQFGIVSTEYLIQSFKELGNDLLSSVTDAFEL